MLFCVLRQCLKNRRQPFIKGITKKCAVNAMR
nr:MAG TPA: hypothetical protein [Caudoviricetes sp.]